MKQVGDVSKFDQTTPLEEGVIKKDAQPERKQKDYQASNLKICVIDHKIDSRMLWIVDFKTTVTFTFEIKYFLFFYYQMEVRTPTGLKSLPAEGNKLEKETVKKCLKAVPNAKEGEGKPDSARKSEHSNPEMEKK